MGLKKAFESLLRMENIQASAGRRSSLDRVAVQEPHFPTLDKLREAAGKAFGTSFTNDPKARHSLYQRGVILTLANVGAHRLSFLFVMKPYFSDQLDRGQAFEKSLLRDDQQQAWAQHTAYMAIDYVKRQAEIQSRYLCSRDSAVSCTMPIPSRFTYPERVHWFLGIGRRVRN